MTSDFSDYFPNYAPRRLWWSFLVPASVIISATLFKEGFWMALLITTLEVLCFCVLCTLLIEGFIAVNRTKREIKWRETFFGVNLCTVMLLFAGVLIPITRMKRDLEFPVEGTVEALRAAQANLGYQALVAMPSVWMGCAVVGFVGLLALSIHKTHQIELLKALVLVLPVAIIAFTTSTVIAGAPFIGSY